MGALAQQPRKSPLKTLGVTSSGLLRNSRIKRILALLGWRVVYAPLTLRLDAVAGWGEKAPSQRARALARRRGLPFLTLEDGFIRSIGLGVERAAPLSLVIDPGGAYFNHQAPSRLSALLSDARWETPALLDRAARGLAALRARRITKYNIAWATPPAWLPERFILVIDQTCGDAAIAGAGADAESFQAMLSAAIAEADGAPVIVKTHPDVMSGARQGYFDPQERKGGAATFLADPVNPWDLIARARRVYAVSSLLGYEAALAGCETHLFGWPFYAGYGLTHDRGAPQRVAHRRLARSREALFAATHLLYPVYYDPVEDRLTTFETALDRLSEGGLA
ncbi:MAG: hypothetical protein AAGM38_06990 [Pseudomonadota bacterium]